MVSRRQVRKQNKQLQQRASQARDKSVELRSVAASALEASQQLPVPAEPKPQQQVASNEPRVLEAWSTAAIVSALKTDVNVGLTMATIASETHYEAKRRRNQGNARLAYDTVARKVQTLFLSRADQAYFDTQLAELRSALESLGERF